ncbi:hypothetical protein GCM10010252_39870 [Streptomyces aureoverticillatus]|nr:hypothetical protein GCM10010252_39870 [Streptomyces aureoverticillatus]
MRVAGGEGAAGVDEVDGTGGVASGDVFALDGVFVMPRTLALVADRYGPRKRCPARSRPRNLPHISCSGAA